MQFSINSINIKIAGICLFLTFMTSIYKQGTGKDARNTENFLFTAEPAAFVADSLHRYYIKTTLQNLGKDTIYYATMSCSYDEYFTNNSDSFSNTRIWDCYANGPIVTKIPPKGKLDQNIVLIPNSISYDCYKNSKLKIGMYFLNRKEYCNTFFNPDDIRNKGRLIWSNEIDLKKLFREIYY